MISFGLAGGSIRRCSPAILSFPRPCGPTDTCCKQIHDCAVCSADRVRRTCSTLAGSSAIPPKNRHSGVKPVARRSIWKSGPVAKTAVERNLPFSVLRVICDPSHHRLPPAACAALDARGAVALGRVLQSLARQPLQLRALLALTVDATRARRAMRRHLNDIAAQEFFYVFAVGSKDRREARNGHAR